LPFEEACAAATDCTVNSCYRGACVACSCSSCATASCDSPTVTGGDASTLATAISVASNGDIITIGPGTYSGDFVWSGKGLKLVGCPDGDDEVILVNASYNTRTISATTPGFDSELVDIVVRGYNDRSDRNAGGGVYTEHSTSVCARTRIENSVVGFTPDNFGAGILVKGDSSNQVLLQVLDHTIVQDNVADSYSGGGVYVDSYADGVIDGAVQILNNTAGNKGAGIVTYPTGALTISGDVLIKGNTAKLNGGGIAINPDDRLTQETPTLTIGGNVVIEDNTATDSYGGGIHLSNIGDLTKFDMITIKDNAQIKGNTAGLGGNGLFITSGKLIIQDDVRITGNGPVDATVNNWGGAINYYDATTDLTVQRVLISGNVVISGNATGDNPDSWGGGIILWPGSMKITDNVTIKNNTSPNGGGVGLRPYEGNCTLELDGNATITKNTATTGGGVLAEGIEDYPATDQIVTISGSATIADNDPDNCVAAGGDCTA
jgi:predicted outer membrane repeat protein